MGWNDGYNNENEYTYTYCADLNPVKIKYTLLMNGFMPPEIKQACELGFGQGLSINFHATDIGTSWTGNDFIPAHVSFASAMQETAGTIVNLSDKSFQEMLETNFDHKFDYICLHGIWSWISEENRACIRSFIRHNLRENGVVYISYNAKPGWASMLPIRDFLSNFIKTNLPISENMDAKTKEAINFSSKLLKSKPLYLLANPHAEKRIDNLLSGDIAYLAHEYFNEDWETFFFSEVDASLSECKLNYAGSTDFMSGMDDINITNEQKKVISELHGKGIREDLRDVYLNQSFRKDVWVKGGVRLTSQEKITELKKLFVILRNPKVNQDYKIKGNLGDGDLQKDIYEPILQYLSEYKVASIENVITALDGIVVIEQVLEAIHVLISKGDLLLAHDPNRWGALEEAGHKINNFIYNKVANGNTCSFLYSAAIGGGLQVNLFQQLFVGTLNTYPGIDTLELAEKCLVILKRLGRSILDEGVKLESYDAELKTLSKKASDFFDSELEHFKFLRIAR